MWKIFFPPSPGFPNHSVFSATNAIGIPDHDVIVIDEGSDEHFEGSCQGGRVHERVENATHMPACRAFPNFFPFGNEGLSLPTQKHLCDQTIVLNPGGFSTNVFGVSCRFSSPTTKG